MTALQIERQPGESSPAWEARKLYIHMGPTRSITRVGREGGKSRGQLEKWSSRWKWVASARDYDVYNDAQVAHAAEEAHKARLKADLERWSAREEQYPEMLYQTFIFAFNALVEAGKKSKETKRPIATRRLALLVRTVQRGAALAREALELTRGRRHVASDASPDPLPKDVAGRALAVLRAYNEYKPKTDDDLLI